MNEQSFDPKNANDLERVIRRLEQVAELNGTRFYYRVDVITDKEKLIYEFTATNTRASVFVRTQAPTIDAAAMEAYDSIPSAAQMWGYKLYDSTPNKASTFQYRLLDEGEIVALGDEAYSGGAGEWTAAASVGLSVRSYHVPLRRKMTS